MMKKITLDIELEDSEYELLKRISSEGGYVNSLWIAVEGEYENHKSLLKNYLLENDKYDNDEYSITSLGYKVLSKLD